MKMYCDNQPEVLIGELEQQGVRHGQAVRTDVTMRMTRNGDPRFCESRVLCFDVVGGQEEDGPIPIDGKVTGTSRLRPWKGKTILVRKALFLSNGHFRLHVDRRSNIEELVTV